MKRISFCMVLLCTILAVSCTKEDGSKGGTDAGGGSQTLLAGTFALDDGTGLTRRYLSFGNKTCYDFSLKDDLADVVVAGGYLWHCKVGDFFNANAGDFSILDGQLICAGAPYGSLTILDDAIMLDEDRFVKFKNFKAAWYTTLSVEAGDTLKYTYRKQDVSVPIKLDKSVQGSVLAASVVSGNTWITDCSIDKGNLVFKLSENYTGETRKGGILITCPGAKDLSLTVIQSAVAVLDISSTSANCYVIPQSGVYKFKTVKGNSSTSVGTVASTEVLWESFGTAIKPSVKDVISTVFYYENYVYFETPSTLKNGNAVIAAKDADGNILWSWHIWVCKDFDPAATAQTYANNAGVMMDRNLGATSATPGDVGALGLLYQWGRKDPFLGGCQISYDSSSNQQNAASTITWPSAVASDATNGRIAYAVQHPTTFITYNSNNFDWYYTGSSSTDNTRWSSTKGIYDPCPPGWRVPDGGSNGVWSKAVGSSEYFSGYPYDNTNKGMNFSGKFGSTSTIWYPAAGYLDLENGSLGGVGNDGSWWSCTPNVLLTFRLGLTDVGSVSPSDYVYRALGFSVRCLQE